MAKYQVCSITINSSDEIETFKEFLSPNDFDFVELLPSKINVAKDHNSHWFDLACEKGYHCDILVISGHFGGTFYGKSKYSLPTRLLEEKTCQNSCQSILSNVKEIFLFGCNTLGLKNRDPRTPEKLLKLLLDEGMARETAEKVVAASHSPLEAPFRSRMNFIFSSSSTAYGFNLLSPLGKYMRKPLRNYFQSINRKFGSYAHYLKSGYYKRSRNTEMFNSLGHLNIDQAHVSQSNENPEKIKFFNDKCRLYNDTEIFTSRLQALKDIFESGQSGLAFSAIDHFLSHNKKRLIEGEGRGIFRSIRTNKSFSKVFLSYYKHLKILPYIKLVYLNILETFQWIKPFNLHLLKKENLLELIKKPDSETYIALILLLKNNQIKPNQFYISKKDLPDNYIQNIWSLLIFEKLKAQAPEWQEDIFKYCKKHIKKNPAVCSQVLNTLAHIKPNPEITQKAVPFLDHQNEGLIYYTIRMLGQSGTKDYHIHKKISSFLTHNDPNIKQETVEALGFLRTPYTDIQTDIAKLLPYANKQFTKDIFWSFSRMNVKSEPAQKKIIQYIENTHDKKLIKTALTALQNTSDFSESTLSFFYDQLKSRDDLDFLFLLIETISKHKQLKDLGIHYYLLQFHKEKSDQFKQRVLEKMSALTWIHPETQIGFLNYVKSRNPRVRNLTISIFRNINNLRQKTIDEMKFLYKQKNIKELKVFF